MQLNGNVSSDDLDELAKSILELKVILIRKDNILAEAELREYCIGEIDFEYSDDINIIENESRYIYNGDDGCYNNGQFKKYGYTFKMSNKYSWEYIKNENVHR